MYSSSAYLPINSEQELYNKILRLHVVANSDTQEDQAMKLYVRDALLCELSHIYEENKVETLNEAKIAIDNNRDRLVLCAKSALCSYSPGCSYDVALELRREYYPTRVYEEAALPAGEYESLIIKIGEGAGQNWWCVLFPRLCLASAVEKGDSVNSYVYEENGEEFVAAGFTPEEIRIITESESDDIKIKFRVLEILGSLFVPQT